MDNRAKSCGPDGSYIDTSYSPITSGLYVGGLSSVHYLPADIGPVNTLVICAQELCNSSRNNLYGFNEVLQFPLRDETAKPPPTHIIEEAASAVARRLHNGWTVLVMCAEGINRSAVVAAKALLQLGYEDPITLLRKQRHRSLLSNRTFETWVRQQTKVSSR